MSRGIRNKDGIWINTSLFNEEARNFMKNGYYCPYSFGSDGWIKYWKEQERRCRDGYEVGGAKITGYHYYYLNFVMIKAIDESTGKKVIRFPDFWDGDYNYFWLLHIADNGISKEDYKKIRLDIKVDEKCLSGNRHIMVAKARRKGFSYKNAAVLSCDYLLVKNSLSIIGSYDKKYSRDTFSKAYSCINFADEHTGFRRQRLIDKRNEHIKSGYIDMSNGIGIEKGYLSEIMAVTYQDNPDVVRGKDINKIILEEMGTFPNAKEAFAATEDAVKDGDRLTGMMIMYGTSSSKEKMTEPFMEMFYNPDLYNILPVYNIWDEDAEHTTCGIFFPVYQNKSGYYDSNGNSDIEGAKKSELAIREKKKENSVVLNNYITENPFSPSEAFRSGSYNIFPVVELTAQLNRVIGDKLYIKKGQPVELYKIDGKVFAKPILDLNKVEPVYFYKSGIAEEKGCVIIYEYPIENSPSGLYIIGYDPYSQDQSKSNSYAAIYVYKGFEKNSYNRDTIVAQYVGRPQEADDANRIALLLAELYNAEVMHENMFIHVKNYFRKEKALIRLAAQPDTVISKNIKESVVSRVYGIHMTEQIKDAGEKYIKDWLLTIRDYDENGEPRYNYEFIYDAGLLQELIKYNRKGNFDRVIALMMIMFKREENSNITYDINSKTNPVDEWIDLVNKKFNYKFR